MSQAPKSVGTCQACNMRFQSLEEMRAHYTTDFHTANVRARVEGESKMSAAEFRRKMVIDDDKKPIFSCKLCKKQFHSVQTLQSHVKSTEHLIRKEQRIIERDSTAGSALSSTSLGSAALGLHRRHKTHLRQRQKLREALQAGASVDAVNEDGTPSVANLRGRGAAADPTVAPKVSAADREADINETRCLFCGHPSKTVRSNLKHMRDVHEFTIPLEHRVKDVRALLQYLGRKVNGLLCLVCGTSTKRYESLEAVRAHMKAAGHERMVLSSEYAEFYEGTIDDGDAVQIETEEGRGALICRGEKNHRLWKKDRTLPATAVRRLKETPSQTEQRRLLTAAGAAESQLMLKEVRRETHRERVHHFKIMNQQQRRHNLFMLRVGIKKLWKKGYDGDGEMA